MVSLDGTAAHPAADQARILRAIQLHAVSFLKCGSGDERLDLACSVIEDTFEWVRPHIKP